MTAPAARQPSPEHTAAAQHAIATEFVRVTLTGDHRPELVQPTLASVFADSAAQVRAALAPITAALARLNQDPE